MTAFIAFMALFSSILVFGYVEKKMEKMRIRIYALEESFKSLGAEGDTRNDYSDDEELEANALPLNK